MHAELKTTKATCPYCGVGCGVLIRHDGERIHAVAGDPDHPANFGRLCSKGSTLHLSARPETRLLYPELRSARGEPRRRKDWVSALTAAAERFGAIIREHGPDAVGFYISGQLLTEDYYVFNKLAKGLVGTNNVDTNSRLCMSSAVSAYKLTLGADAPPCAYEDFAAADCFLIAGSNMAYAHPVAFRRIEAARAARPGTRMIVVDPRRTDTASSADLHLAIRPGTDIWLYNALLHVLIRDGLVDHAFIEGHTEGFAALAEHVRGYTPEVAAEICGVPPEDIVLAARWWGEAPAAMSLWCQGLNQSRHGTHNGAALIALALATGKIGRPGCGPFSLTGQPNAMGGREVGGLANLLSAHRDLADPLHREEVARLWGVESVPAEPGLSAVELFEAVRAGRVKALWIACTNPAHSMPDQALIRAAMERCEFVVVQEACANTETAAFADLLLPATTWGEKEGTVTNSERRISHVRAAVAAPGEARADWRIARDFALALGPELDKAELAARLFAYGGPEAVFREHAETTRGRDLDIGGLDYARLDAQGPQQWPCPAGAAAGKVRLYEDGVFPTADGRARFVVPVADLTAEETDERFPLQLTSGRLRDQWHCMSRSGKVARLFNHVDEPRIEMNACDMRRRGIAEGELVRVSSRRGGIVLRAAASPAVARGQAFVAMHWGRNSLNSSGVNELTLGAFDPYSKQPELKHAAIRVDKAELPYETILLRSEVDDETAAGRVLDLAAAAAPLLSRFDYAALFLAGREHPAVVLRIAHREAIARETLDELDRVFGLRPESCLSYRDERRHVAKLALVEDGVLTGVRLSGETAAAAWLQEVLVGKQTVSGLRAWLLAPLAQPPVATAARGRVVCNCLNVSESEIREEMAAGADFAGLQEKLGCGTSCGSCVPEIRRMLVN